MKKTLILVSFGLMVAMISCKKQQENYPEKQPVNYKTSSRLMGNPDISLSPRGFLVFANEDAYDKALQDLATMNDGDIRQWEASLNYRSLFDELSEAEEKELTVETTNSSIEDDLFHTLINHDGLVQIGNYIFKADFDKGYVTELNNTDADKYFNGFVAGNFIEGVTNRFDLGEEDAFDRLNSGLKGYNSAKTTGIFGSDDKYDDIVTVKSDGIPPTKWKAKCKASYQKVVFYFSLMTEMKYEKKDGMQIFWHGWDTHINLDVCDYAYSSRNGRNGNDAAYFWTVNSNKLNFRPYAEGRGLKGGSWHLYATYKYENVADYRNWRAMPHWLQIAG